MKNETFAQRLIRALKYRGMKQTQLAQLSGIYRGTINNYVAGKYEPKQLNLWKIAQVLNVSETWLMGFDVPMEKDDPKTTIVNLIDDSKIEIIGQIMKVINELDIKDLLVIKEMLDLMIDVNDKEVNQLSAYIKFLRIQSTGDK